MPLIFSHAYDGSVPAGHSVTGATNATVIDATGAIAAASGPRITHDLDGQNPRLLLEPACLQALPNPADMSQWQSGGALMADLGQDGIFRKISLASNGQTWHNWGQTAGQAVSLDVDDHLTVTWLFDPASDINPRISLNTSSYANIEGAFNTSSSFSSAIFAGVAQTYTVIRPDMVLRTYTARAKTPLTVTGLTIWMLTTNTALRGYFYGMNLTTLPYKSSFVTGDSRTADLYAPFALSAPVSQGTVVARAALPQRSYVPSGALLTLQNGASSANNAALVYDADADAFEAQYTHADAPQTSGLSHPANDDAVQAAFAFAQDDFAVSFDGEAALMDSAGSVAPLDTAVVSSSLPLELYALDIYSARQSDAFLQDPVAPGAQIDLLQQAVAWTAAPHVTAQTPLPVDVALPDVGLNVFTLAPAAIAVTPVHGVTAGSVDLFFTATPALTAFPAGPALMSAAAQHILLTAFPGLGGSVDLPRTHAVKARASSTAVLAPPTTLFPRP